MQKRFKGVICSAENVCFPASIVYEGVEYPVVCLADITVGDYLLAFLDTTGDPTEILPVYIKAPLTTNVSDKSRYGRIDANEPVVRMTYLRTDSSLKVPAYLDPKTMRLVGMHLRTTTGTVYIPLKSSQYNKFQRSLHSHGFVMATNQCVESVIGSVFNIQLHATIDAARTMVVKGMPVNIVGVVFEGDVEYTPSLHGGVIPNPAEISLLNLDTDNYEEAGSVLEYGDRSYIVKAKPSVANSLVIAFDGKPRTAKPLFGILTTPTDESVIELTRLKQFTLKD